MSGIKNNPRNIWKRINKKGEDECWEWMGCKSRKGYGLIKINYKMYSVHRVVYEQIYGSIPGELLICHKCNNPKCCNPKHLYLGTQKDNLKQMVVEGRSARGEKHSHAKLTEENILEIRKLYFDNDYTFKELGKLFYVSISNIHRIIKKTIWKHVKEKTK